MISVSGIHLEREVARGQSSTIYQGAHLESGKAVAIKVPHSVYGSPEHRGRLEAAVREVARARIEGLPEPYGVVDADDRFALVTRWVEGTPLSRLELEPARWLELLADLGDIIAQLHGRGLTHGHLSERKALVGLDRGREGRAWLLDTAWSRAQLGKTVPSECPPEVSWGEAWQPPGDQWAFAGLCLRCLAPMQADLPTAVKAGLERARSTGVAGRFPRIGQLVSVLREGRRELGSRRPSSQTATLDLAGVAAPLVPLSASSLAPTEAIEAVEADGDPTAESELPDADATRDLPPPGPAQSSPSLGAISPVSEHVGPADPTHVLEVARKPGRSLLLAAVVVLAIVGAIGLWVVSSSTSAPNLLDAPGGNQ